MVFILDSIHRMFQISIIQQNVFLLIMPYCCNNTYNQIICALLLSSKRKYIFGFNPPNYPIATPAASSFI